MHKPKRSLWDKIWKDKDGQIVIWQRPNAPLLIWLVTTVLSLVIHGKLADILSIIGSISLAIWAILEIWSGVNYIRRALGLLVLFFIIAGFFGIGK